ncbi:Calpain-5 [Armadillidium vulgare]|nr:Calpain-5 [Armadillidium vulgare]
MIKMWNFFSISVFRQHNNAAVIVIVVFMKHNGVHLFSFAAHQNVFKYQYCSCHVPIVYNILSFALCRMTFEDFVENFTDLSICFLINTSMFSLSKTWSESQFSSGWTIGVKGHCSDRAGGCPNHKDSFLRNPQYRFDVKEEEDDVLIQLMQRDAREKRKEGVLNLVIGFHIMKVELFIYVEANRRYRVHTIHEPVATSDYIRTRSIFLREQLKRGRYVIVPTTFKPNETGEFLLRLFTSKDPDAKELIDDQPKIAWYSCVKKPAMLTTVSIKSASDLQKQTAFGDVDKYFVR